MRHFYDKQTLTVEVLKDDEIHKVFFPVKNKVRTIIHYHKTCARTEEICGQVNTIRVHVYCGVLNAPFYLHITLFPNLIRKSIHQNTVIL